ncbi:MAG: hypothetical protein BGO78_16710 [Chloroflexi bacterium 44-23]|nr:MAG: hypothetical protein BGO78_16710 [Chloroflexi bacterium 44-23]
MNFLNLGVGEIIFIILIALIIFGPGNMVKSAREIGTFLRKVTKSPYWQEVWATQRELKELPKIMAKEAQLDETIKNLDRSTSQMRSSLTNSVADLIKEIDEPLKVKNELEVAVEIPKLPEPKETNREQDKSLL